MPRKGRSGRRPMNARALTSAEYQRRYRLKRKAKEMGVENVEELIDYNVFAPELEARGFVDALIEKEGNLASAVRAWKPSMRGYSNDQLIEVGQRLIEGGRIKKLINEFLDSKKVSIPQIVSDIYDISQNKDAQDKDRLRALELLGKFKQIFDDTKDSGNVYNLNISNDAAERLLKRRNIIDVIPGEAEPDRLCDSNAE